MKLDMKFTEPRKAEMKVNFSGSEETTGVDFEEIQSKTVIIGDAYTGDYEITPRVVAQTLRTRNKVLTEDVIVSAIPIYEVSNSSGGSTVFIAKEM